MFNLISSKNKTFFILGDFINNLLAGKSRISRIIKSNKLTQIIDKPTRVASTSSTL